MSGWADHAIWWHVYPLGFTGALGSGPGHRLGQLVDWLDYAVELGVSERTIKAQRARMFEKLHIETVPELVRAANMLQNTTGAREPAAWQWFGSRPAVPQKCET